MGLARIREATAADASGLATLMGVRDGLPGPHPAAARALFELDATKIRIWIAVDAEDIVAMSCAELRRLRVGNDVIDAAYWTNLYVREDYRDQLLYPRLPQAMLRGLADAAIARVYTAIRRPDVAKGHLQIGFREIDRLVVRLKPLRPLSLVSKRKGLGARIVGAAGRIDRVAGLAMRVPGWRPRLGGVSPLTLAQSIDELASLLSSHRAGKVTRCWDSESLGVRYRPAADGEEYRFVGVRNGEGLVGAAAFRLATREHGIRVGAVLDLAARNDDPALLRALLRAVERAVRAEGGDGVLVVDGLGPELSRIAKSAGYLDTGERYVLMVAPRRKIDDDDPILDAAAWRFPLADHDAF